MSQAACPLQPEGNMAGVFSPQQLAKMSLTFTESASESFYGLTVGPSDNTVIWPSVVDE